MKIWINGRTGRLVVVDREEDWEDERDDWETEPNPIIFHPVCRADEIAWWLRLPGRMVARQGERNVRR